MRHNPPLSNSLKLAITNQMIPDFSSTVKVALYYQKSAQLFSFFYLNSNIFFLIRVPLSVMIYYVYNSCIWMNQHD